MQEIQKLIAGILFLVSFSFAGAGDVAIHPAPKKPALITDALTDSFRMELPRPPAAGSEEQKHDEQELLKLQGKRTKKDCARARAEVYVNLAAFFGGAGGNLSEAEVKALDPFFAKVRNDADYYIQILKREFPRKRPHLYVAGLSPCVPKEVTGAFPSGHATLARLFALILGDFFPERKTALFSRAEQLALDRVISGMHHPTDIEAGKRLADLVYNALKRSRGFNDFFAEIRRKLKSSQTVRKLD